MAFTAGSELIDARERLREMVDDALTRLAAGESAKSLAREQLDFKEEAGRRGSGGILLPGTSTNSAAADHLADEVACMANTPGGGVLIVGVDDKTSSLLGASMDSEWLRQRIYRLVDIAPVIEERRVQGVRLLIVLVAQSREPVEDRNGRVRWRVGDSCAPVDRAEWWLLREQTDNSDLMARPTTRTIADVSSAAIRVARSYLGVDSGQSESVSDAAPAELLSRLGVLRPDGRLSQAGALMFCPSDRTLLSLVAIDVEGGDLLLEPADLAGLSLLEQIQSVEARLDVLNTSITLTGAFAEPRVRRLPPRAVREAILNGVAHREWMNADPTSVTWIDADSVLEVVSPGGFSGGISSHNVLTHRYVRHPALTDLLRALKLVEKQGLGVDRMVRDMVALGYRTPLVVEEEGPRVRARLSGGRPVRPTMDLVAAIRPTMRQNDVRVALIVHTLLQRPFVTADLLTELLQRPEAESQEAIEAAADCQIDAGLLLFKYKDVWTLSTEATAALERSRDQSAAPGARDSLPYLRPEDGSTTVAQWLASHDRITTTDYATMSALSTQGARNQLDRLTAVGALIRGVGMGRNAHYTAGQGLPTVRVPLLGID